MKAFVLRVDFRVTTKARCFLHIINLACKAVIEAFSSLNPIDDIPHPEPEAPMNGPRILSQAQVPAAVGHGGNTLVKLCGLVRAVCQMFLYDFVRLKTYLFQIRASSLRREQFAITTKAVLPSRGSLQLLRDVDTRWSSLLYMIDRALQLEKVSRLCNHLFGTSMTVVRF